MGADSDKYALIKFGAELGLYLGSEIGLPLIMAKIIHELKEEVYSKYDDEVLFDEYVDLSRKVRFGYFTNNQIVDKVKLEAVKSIMKNKKWIRY
ncbi:MAG: hypothetical protein NC548_37870 [Lachnospiraceae bacterium]|nr:hypothetical protein [Lachnospiraceae bacterium]MCM1231181.1 hypothetical protein [Ruminococcus flavefaciens]